MRTSKGCKSEIPVYNRWGSSAGSGRSEWQVSEEFPQPVKSRRSEEGTIPRKETQGELP